jgi:hypothetical protein
MIIYNLINNLKIELQIKIIIKPPNLMKNQLLKYW